MNKSSFIKLFCGLGALIFSFAFTLSNIQNNFNVKSVKAEEITNDITLTSAPTGFDVEGTVTSN